MQKVATSAAAAPAAAAATRVADTPRSLGFYSIDPNSALATVRGRRQCIRKHGDVELSFARGGAQTFFT
jgi:ABC-type nitrate/sulfonate/bicarbonate transport system substrate-binding protein